jgi:hypothetical protein
MCHDIEGGAPKAGRPDPQREPFPRTDRPAHRHAIGDMDQATRGQREIPAGQQRERGGKREHMRVRRRQGVTIREPAHRAVPRQSFAIRDDVADH